MNGRRRWTLDWVTTCYARRNSSLLEALSPQYRVLPVSDIEFDSRLIYGVIRSHAVAVSSQSLPAYSVIPIHGRTIRVQVEVRDQVCGTFLYDHAVRACFFMRVRTHFSLTPIGRERHGVLSRLQFPISHANLT